MFWDDMEGAGTPPALKLYSKTQDDLNKWPDIISGYFGEIKVKNWDQKAKTASKSRFSNSFKYCQALS